jgi:DNA-binding MarR family transcriptional regulator
MAKSPISKNKGRDKQAKSGAPGVRPPGQPEEIARRRGEFRIGFLIHDVSRMRRTLYDQAFKPLGITRSQWWVLANLSRRQEGLTQTELAEMLDVGKVTLGGLIDRLEAGGHVERRSVDHDRRAKQVVITERGQRTLESMRAIGSDLSGQILNGLVRSRVLETEDVLYRMKDNLRQALAETAIESEEAL